MPKLHSINDEQRLFVIAAPPDGFTCLGFDVERRRSHAIAEWLGCPEAVKAEPGTPEAWVEYEFLLTAGRAHSTRTGERCQAELTPQLVGLEDRLVKVTDKYGETRRFIVGRSTGWMPCHLEIPNRRSTGGLAVTGAPFESVRLI